MPQLAILGCGHMGKAILKGLLHNNGDSSNSLFEKYIVSVTNSTSASKLETEFQDSLDHVTILCQQNLKAVSNADVVLLAFPPNQLRAVLSEKGLPSAISKTFIVSVLAGISLEQIENLVMEDAAKSTPPPPIMRAIPSMGAQALESATLLVDEDPSPPSDKIALAESLFATIGKVHHTPAHLFNSLTAVNGVCHALMSVAFDSLVDSCVAVGIPRSHTLAVASQCFVGYAKLVADGKEPVDLKNSLLIPNGLTVQAMLNFERGGLRGVLEQAVRDTKEYTDNMGK